MENVNGACLQAVWASATRIEAAGNRSIVIYPNPQRVPSVIDVSGTTSWGVPPAPQRTPTNMRVIVRLSELQQDKSGVASMVIQRKLQYAVPDGAFGVVVHGCGASSVRCEVVDANNKASCRLTEKCTTSVATAKSNMLLYTHTYIYSHLFLLTSQRA